MGIGDIKRSGCNAQVLPENEDEHMLEDERTALV
jgi:hypothetical protein